MGRFHNYDFMAHSQCDEVDAYMSIEIRNSYYSMASGKEFINRQIIPFHHKSSLESKLVSYRG